mmetsp:Transcript_2331/g.3180  ORF Transcript_2331/g.3180 Transcript_2331/m.3180 type:complete len:92 (+) Transcript_2331:436-711(+)
MTFSQGTYLGSYWSIFKFQPIEDVDGKYTDDYRVTPQLKDLVGYVFKRRVYGSTTFYSYFKGSTITLASASPGVTAISAAISITAALFVAF